MKQIVFTFLLFFNCISVFCQLHEGYFQYDIDVEAKDTSMQMKQTAAMLRNSKMELYFMPGKTRLNFVMGQLSTTNVIVDKTNNITLSLSNSFQGKQALIGKYETPTQEIKEIQKTKETAVILGYKCYKIYVIEGGVKTEYWLTNDIKIDEESQKILNQNLPGFPVKFAKQEGGMLMTFQLTNMKEEIVNKEIVFSTTVPEGYTIVKTTK